MTGAVQITGRGFRFRAHQDVAQRTAAYFDAAGQPCAEFIQWMYAWDDRTIVCKNGSLLACFEIAGLDIDSTDNVDLNQVRGQLQYAYEQLQDHGITMGWQVARRLTTDYPQATFPDPVSARIDELQHLAFQRTPQFINRHTISLYLEPADGAQQLLSRISRAVEGNTRGAVGLLKDIFGAMRSAALGEADFPYQGRNEVQVAVERFERVVGQFVASLGNIGIQQLHGDALGAFLASTASPTMADLSTGCLPQNAFLDTSLPRNAIDNDYQNVLKFSGNEGELWSAVYSLDLHKRERLGLNAFDALIAAPFEFTLVQVFKFLSKASGIRAISEMERYHSNRRYPLKAYVAAAFNGGHFSPELENKVRAEQGDEAKALKDSVDVGNAGVGLWHGAVMVLAPDIASLEAHCRQTEKILEGARFSPTRETLHKLSSFCAGIPGSHGEVVKWSKITTENWVDLATIRTVSAGNMVNNWLSEQSGQTCPALLVLPTKHNTPYYFTGYVGDLGHTLMLGPSGAGKTTFVNLAWSAFRKYPGARVIGLDRDHSMRPAIGLQGGKYLDMTPEKQLTQQTRLGPLRALMADGNLAHLGWITQWVERLAKSRGYTPTSMDRQELEVKLRSVAEIGIRNPEMLRLSTLVVSLDQTTELAQNLMQWTEGSVYGSYFDNGEDQLDVEQLVGAENGRLLESEELATPYMDYLFYRISSMLRREKDESGGVSSRPTLISIPEIAYMIRNETFRNELEQWLTTFRKLNAAVWLDTQSPDRLVESSIYSALRDNIATTIFTPNPKALAGSLSQKYRDEFLLSQSELNFLAEGTFKRDYYIKQNQISRRISLSLDGELLAYLRSDARAQALYERHARTGDKHWVNNYVRELNGG